MIYKSRNRKRHYLPDFKLNNNLIEIKGDQFFKEQNQLISLCDRKYVDIALAKKECMLENNVQIWRFKGIKPILEYITQKYGENYLDNFKIKKLKSSKNN